jgi:nucleotide-binding universal stress UspA family protein
MARTLSRVLIGDDGSPGAAAARAWGEALAGATGAEVVEATVDAQTIREPPAPATGAASRRPVGEPAMALLARADEIGADLIVVGRRGAGGFEALRLGSTAHQVVEHATRPVAVVPSSGRAVAGGWPFATIVVGLDGSPVAAGALSWSVPLAVASSATVLAVHAMEIGPAFMAAGLVDSYAQAAARLSEAVEEWCEPLRAAGVTYATVLEEGGPAGVLLEAVRTRDADLLVVGRRSGGAFPGMEMGSAAHRALGFSPCTTAVVPEST